MKRNQVNDIFEEDTRRKRIIIFRAVLISIIFALSICLFVTYLNKSKVEYVNYNETSSVNYNVHLKENEFYKENTIKENNQYVSELIDYINVRFLHKINIKKDDYTYNYSYRIEANAVVIDKTTNKNVYTYNEVLVPNQEFTARSKETNIIKDINIDYNKYNNLIGKFIQTYGIEETENILRVNLIVSMGGNCDEENSNGIRESVTTLEIPLTRKTVSIDFISNLIDEDDNVMLCIKPSNTCIIYIIFTIITFILGILLLVRLILYVINTRSARTVYYKELKRILSNYRSYIQKINSKFSLAGYQVLKVDNFTDMLEIRDTTNQPILMVENSGKESVYFIIPTSTKILYTYGIRVSDIEKEMQEKNN